MAASLIVPAVTGTPRAGSVASFRIDGQRSGLVRIGHRDLDLAIAFVDEQQLAPAGSDECLSAHVAVNDSTVSTSCRRDGSCP